MTEREPELADEETSGLTLRRVLVGVAVVTVLVFLVAALVAVGWILVRLLFGLGDAAISGG